MTPTAAWILRAGPENQPGTPGELARETLRLPDLTDWYTLVEPIYGSWDANISHTITRNPVDVARQRGEDSILLGNIGVVRVLRSDPGVTTIEEGNLCLLMPFGRRDEFGYAELAYAYDAPGTLGLLAERTVVPTDLLLPLPRDSHHTPRCWTPYARYFTAWDNWRVAHACWRSQMGEADPGEHLVFGWGGGVVLVELELARRAGFRVAMAASTDQRLAQLTAQGIESIDQRLFPDRADPTTYLGAETGVPGVTESGGRWLAEHRVRAAGADTTAFEQVLPGRGHLVMPVHRLLLVEQGIHIIEHLRLEELAAAGVAEFTFVLTSLKIVGGTGSPVRPLALTTAARKDIR
jgi:NADPH:quinone reductase-like Zn-dependent oxidoreductase